VLLSFNGPIYVTFTAYDSNLNYVKAQISDLVPLRTLNAFLIFSKFEMKNYLLFCLYINMAISVLSIDVVTVLFINLVVLLKRCFTRKNTCLCELIRCAGCVLCTSGRKVSPSVPQNRGFRPTKPPLGKIWNMDMQW